MIKKFKFPLINFFFVFLALALTLWTYKFLLNVPFDAVIGDAQRYNGYQAYIIKYSIDNFGQFALWDQFLSSGMSWISHPGGPLFFPTTWIVIALFKEMMLGSRIYFLIHAATAVVAMYFFLRILDVKKFVSFVISTISVVTQYSLIFGANGWFEEFFGLTLLPLTAGLFWLSLTKKSYNYAVLGGLAMSLNFFGNSYYVFHYNAIAILWIGSAFSAREFWSQINKRIKEWQTLFRYLVINIIFWIVAIGISSVKLFPLLEFREISARNILPLSMVEGNALPFSFLEKILRDFIIPAGHTTSFTQIANDLSLFFAILSLIYFLVKRSFAYFVFLTLLILGIWGYLANLVSVDLYAFIYHFLPGFNSNNYPYRFMIIIHFAFLTLIALGFNLLMRKNDKALKLVGILLGLIMLTSTIYYAVNTTNSLKYQQTVNVQDKLKDFPDFRVIKNQDLKNPPTLKGSVPDNLLSVLSVISKAYGIEGRAYSTTQNVNESLTSINVYGGKIRSVHHSYNPIVPSYQYGIIPQGGTNDNNDITLKRYKTLSILNARFHLQGKEFFEFETCNKLDLDDLKFTQTTKNKENCDYLENRLSLLLNTETGALYYDSDVLQRVTVISNPILVIGDNRFKDYSGFIAKQLMFHPDFNVKKATILSGEDSYLDSYNLKRLKQFIAVIIVDPKIKNKELTNNLLLQYEREGGRVFRLNSAWRHYESLHERSSSIYKSDPAWNYSEEDGELLGKFFRSLQMGRETEIAIKRITPEESIFDVTTRENNQVLQFSDSFYPGWKATINGENVPVYMADGLVKGVLIPSKGKHRIKLYYSPDSLRNGGLVSFFTLLTVAGISFRNKLKRIC